MNYGFETAHALENFFGKPSNNSRISDKNFDLSQKNASKALKYTKELEPSIADAIILACEVISSYA